MTKVVTNGTAYTSSDVDYTIKVEATGLQPFTNYYYQFTVCQSDKKSIIGKTKTTPNPTDDTQALNLAVYSCANYPFGVSKRSFYRSKRDLLTNTIVL